jgi:hypothetical protein
VEFHVAHACDEEKVAKLRQLNLASIEIDLSRISRHAPRQVHVEQILRTAPRHWLHNAKVAAEETRLRLLVAEREAAEFRRRQRQYGRIVKEVASAWGDESASGHPSWTQQMSDSGLAGYVGLAVPGGQCFAVDAATWQSALLDLALVRLQGGAFTADAMLRNLQHNEMLKAPFMIRRNWEPELVAHIRECLPDFRSPTEAVVDYADMLTERGILRRSGGSWRSDGVLASQTRQRIAAGAASRQRLATLREKLDEIAKAAPSRAATLMSWLDLPMAGTDGTPSVVARRGGEDWLRLERQMEAIAAMVRPGGRPLPAAGLLGLPLEDERLAREAEERARREESRRLHEEWRAREEERRRRESSEFVDALTVAAEDMLGADEGRAWVEAAIRAVGAADFEVARFSVGSAARSGIRDALERERMRIEQLRRAQWLRQQAEDEAAATQARCRAKLEAEALLRFATQDRAHLWLRSTQRSLGGQPMTHCRDERSFNECMRLLEVALPRGGRHR